jgi:hypothetical protein
LPRDTIRFEVVDDAVAAVLRSKTPAQRVEMAFQAEAFARTLTAAGVRSRHPDWNVEEIEREVARIWLFGSA